MISLCCIGAIFRQSAGIACGALGHYDRTVVERLAEGLGCDATPVHLSETTILHTTGEPVESRAPRTFAAPSRQGFHWGAFTPPGEKPPGNWKEAARAGYNGLEIGPREAFLHAAEAGVPPVFWCRDETRNAVYFSSRIDPLVRALPDDYRLTVDWRAWASLLTVGYTTRDHTPFTEIRRLRPDQRLLWWWGKTKVPKHKWPWATVTPKLGLEEGADRVLDALRGGIARYPGQVRSMLLSGGLDSRLIAALAAERWPDITAITTNFDEGHALDESLAGAVAGHLGLEHELVEPGGPADYAAQHATVCHWGDYLHPCHPWLLRAFERVVADSTHVLYGFGETLLQSRLSKDPAKLVDRHGTGNVGPAVWRLQKRKRAWAFSDEFNAAAEEPTRAGFHRQASSFEKLPRRFWLTMYRTYAVNGMCSWQGTLPERDGARLATPFTDPAVVRALLAVKPLEAMNGRLSATLLERLSPGLSSLPSTRDRPVPAAAPTPIRRAAPDVVDYYTGLLAESPLRPWFSADLEAAVAGNAVSADPHCLGTKRFYGVEAIANFELWRRRYSDRLGSVDPADLLAAGETPAGSW